MSINCRKGNKMKITVETNAYSQHRYGKPWTGDHRNGGEGILSISANPGDIIAQGQKDAIPDAKLTSNEALIKVLEKCASYIKTVSKNDINQADYDLLELVEETILIKRNIT